MKKCSECKLNKEDSDFRLYRGKRKSRCRSCENAYLRSYRLGARRSELLAKRRSYNAKLSKSKKKSYNLYRKYGISLELYNSMLESQGGLCLICSNPESLQNRFLSVDQCHKTGKVRGLLCGRCNKALGLLNDDLSVLKSAMLYLKKSK